VRLAGGNRTPVELARCPGRTTPGECAPTMSDDDSVARKTLDRSAATTLRDDRGDPSSVRSSTARPALWLRPNPGSAMIPSWVKAPRLRNGAPARRTVARSARSNDTHRGHTEGATPAPRKRNDTEKNPNRRRTPQVPETKRPHNEPDRHRAPQVQQKRKETPPPQARTDNAPNPERPEPTRRRASGGASSFTRFSGFRFPVRLAPDLRRWRAVPRRAGAVVVGGAPTDRVGGHAGDDGDLNETVSGSPWVTRARPDT